MNIYIITCIYAHTVRIRDICWSAGGRTTGVRRSMRISAVIEAGAVRIRPMI